MAEAIYQFLFKLTLDTSLIIAQLRWCICFCSYSFFQNTKNVTLAEQNGWILLI